MTTYDQLLRLIRDGEPVSAAIPNRPLRTLDERVRYMYELIQAAGIGSTLFMRQATVAATVNVGQPVYFNASTTQFEPALAVADTDLATGLLQLAASGQVWGVVHEKLASTKADVLLLGYAALDLTSALQSGETLTAGLYYLSAQTAGRLTATKPAAAIPVLRADGSGRVYVNPQWADPLLDHSHCHFALRPVPAGDHADPGIGGNHTITSEDTSVEGWLPAASSQFAGLAPAGATFGYNIGANAALAAVWPPVPIQSATLLQDGVQVPVGTTGKVILDANGIWWMSDCYGQVPFPDMIVTTSGSEVSESSDTDPCYNYSMTLDLYFTRFSFLTSQTVVTNLTTSDSRVKITRQGGTAAAATGPLAINLDLSFGVGGNTETGYYAFKEFNSTTQTFTRGPVVTGLYAGGANVTLSGATANSGTQSVYVGPVQISVSSDDDKELPVQLVRLDGAVEEYVEDVMYIGLPQNEETSFRSRIQVPETLALANPELTISLRVLGRVSGTLPALTVTWRAVPKPGSGTAENLPTADTSATLTYETASVTSNQYVTATTGTITVAAGDDILFTVTRGAGDGYAGDIGILRQAGIVAAGT